MVTPCRCSSVVSAEFVSALQRMVTL